MSSLEEAKKQVERHKRDIFVLMAHISDRLEDFGEGEEINWGHEGELAYLRKQLIHATCFISGLGEGDVAEVLEELQLDD
jgi:hypothetical protein